MEVKLDREIWSVDFNRRLGASGGFGEVFEGEGTKGETVAIKQLHIRAGEAAHRELAVADDLAGRELQHVLPIFDCGQDTESDRYYVVMPLASGDLQDYVERNGPLTVDTAVDVLTEIIHGLGEVPHLVHRDLKPPNILLHDGSWKIADFGIARFVEATTSLRTLRECLSPQYGAPEQWLLERATTATDLYALGCIAFFLLTGRPPFDGQTSDQLKEQHLHQNPPSLDVGSHRLESLFHQLLRKRQETRPSLNRVSKQLSALADDDVELSVLARADARNAEQVAREEAQQQRRVQEEQLHEKYFSEAQSSLEQIVNTLTTKFRRDAPTVKITTNFMDSNFNGNFHFALVELGTARLTIKSFGTNFAPLEFGAMKRCQWDAIAQVVIRVTSGGRYPGTEAVLWYVRLPDTDEYRWYEVRYSFIDYFLTRVHTHNFVDIHMKRGHARVIFGPVPIDDEDLDKFCIRWSELLGAETVRDI